MNAEEELLLLILVEKKGNLCNMVNCRISFVDVHEWIAELVSKEYLEESGGKLVMTASGIERKRALVKLLGKKGIYRYVLPLPCFEGPRISEDEPYIPKSMF